MKAAYKINLLNNTNTAPETSVASNGARTLAGLPRLTPGTTRRNSGKEVTHGHMNDGGFNKPTKRRRTVRVVELNGEDTPGQYYKPRTKPNEGWTYITGSGRARQARSKARWLEEQRSIMGPNFQELLDERAELRQKLVRIKLGMRLPSYHSNSTIPLSDHQFCWEHFKLSWTNRRTLLFALSDIDNLPWPETREGLYRQIVELRAIYETLEPFDRKLRAMKAEQKRQIEEDRKQAAIEAERRKVVEAKRVASVRKKIDTFIIFLREQDELNAEQPFDPDQLYKQYADINRHATDEQHSEAYALLDAMRNRWEAPLRYIDGLDDDELHWGESRSRFKRLAAQHVLIALCKPLHKAPGSMDEHSTKRRFAKGHLGRGHRNGYDPDYRKLQRRNKRKLERAAGIDRW